jgi:hypothetical protein
MNSHEHLSSTGAHPHQHMRRAGAAVLWVGGLSIGYLMLGLPLAFASLYLTEYLAIVFAVPALPAVGMARLGLHPIAAVVATVVAYWAAGFGVIEWRAHHKHTRATGAFVVR